MQRPIIMRSLAVLAVGIGQAATGDVSLELRAVDDVVLLGEDAVVGLYAVSETPGMDHPIAAIEAVMAWDPAVFTLVGLDATGGAPLIFSGFPSSGSGGLNEAIVPQDGDLFYLALGQLGTAIDATPAGTLITSFVFEAVSSGTDRPFEILPSGGAPAVETTVFDGVIPNTDVTCALGTETVSVSCGIADLAPPFGTLDFSDVIAFLSFFDDMDPEADFAVPFGTLDFSDVIAFLIAFDAGCP